MKKLLMLLGIIFTFALSLGLIANAEEVTPTEDENVELPSAGIKPGSVLYGLDKFLEKVSLAVTFSDEARAEKLAKIAEERLAELSELNPEVARNYADELFTEYGLNVEKANIYVQKVAADGKVSEEQLQKLEKKVDNSEAKETIVKAENRNLVNTGVEEKVKEAINTSKMSIFARFQNIDAIKPLHEQGYGYGQLLKLQAISELTRTSITNLLSIKDAVTTDENGEKTINLDVIYAAKNITAEQVKDKLAEYRDIAKENMKGEIDKATKRANDLVNEIKANKGKK